ncbi:MAG: hypothetical protein ABI769_17340 [Pseudomonadota bacterium]
MKKTLSIFLLTALFALFGALPAQAVKGRPSAITFDDAGSGRKIYAFVKGDNGHLVSKEFAGSGWTWTDHGLPEGVGSISNPKAVTYLDSSGNRRIYVFVVDSTGHLAIRFYKGPSYGWQWSKQGGPWISGQSLSATTYVDDAGILHLYAFAFSTNSGGAVPFKLVKHYWNGSAWGWSDMGNYASLPYNNGSFTETTTYIGNDGRRRLDVFCVAGDDQALLRHSLVEQSWSMSNLGSLVDLTNASSVNFVNSAGYRTVNTFVRNNDYETIWNRAGGGWTEIGKPASVSYSQQGLISATAYQSIAGYPHVLVFVEWEKHLYLRVWVNNSWQPWANLGRPSSSSTSATDGVKNTTAITYLDSDSALQHTRVFMTGAQNDHLYVNFLNGLGWQWSDLGNP